LSVDAGAMGFGPGGTTAQCQGRRHRHIQRDMTASVARRADARVTQFRGQQPLKPLPLITAAGVWSLPSLAAPREALARVWLADQALCDIPLRGNRLATPGTGNQDPRSERHPTLRTGERYQFAIVQARHLDSTMQRERCRGLRALVSARLTPPAPDGRPVPPRQLPKSPWPACGQSS
jgi:hypothetical protein